MLNIPMLSINISETCSTSPADDLCIQGLEDVEDVEPKKAILNYLLTLCSRLRGIAIRPVTPWRASSYSHAYLGLNILNIPNTTSWPAVHRDDTRHGLAGVIFPEHRCPTPKEK